MLQVSTNDQDHKLVLDHHRRLLKILLTNELLSRNCDQYEWKDDFKNETLQILAQHAVQGRMNRLETAMTRWLVYCQIHSILPLDHRVFNPILDKVRMHVNSMSLKGKHIILLDPFEIRFVELKD